MGIAPQDKHSSPKTRNSLPCRLNQTALLHGSLTRDSAYTD
eukprot:CAMPEP_0169348980 /NCGR_PEP_ID=MMETSP1017-20121227/23468_1 /TAXON_ID=342587 /ORGANISM="Karlodinium micrum, Strain CCMP2283" /LENGTH=40 /DNA_ID= /DNA_START= /DNA_END= /DNA_ORIENTATION=